MKTKLIFFQISLVVALLFGMQLSCISQPVFLFEGRFINGGNRKLLLNKVIGHKEVKVKEQQTNADGSFSMSFNELPHPGQYRLRIDPGARNGILNFLITGEPHIRFTTHFDFLIDSIRIEKSDINQAWYDYFGLKEDYENRLSILEHLLNIYPNDGRFYPVVIKEFGLLQDELEQKIQAIISRFPNTLLASYIRSDAAPRIDPYMSAEERQLFVRNNFLNNVDFTDTTLLYTDLFPGKTLSFIMLFRGQRLDRDQQEQEFIKAADNLLPLAMMQPVVYNYLLEYTISGFEQIGMEKVLLHIAENYPVDESCMSDHDSGELQKRVEGYRLLAPGNKAPEIKTTDINGKSFKLSESKARNTLIVFWASWCPHCAVLLPQLRELAQQLNANTGNVPLQVVSVSIDHDKEDYEHYLDMNNLRDKSLSGFWINLCDYQAWDGKVAGDYYLYATPTMVLVDQNMQIVGKPSTLQDLKKHLGI